MSYSPVEPFEPPFHVPLNDFTADINLNVGKRNWNWDVDGTLLDVKKLKNERRFLYISMQKVLALFLIFCDNAMRIRER
jgi:hypothetical protein